MSRVLTELSIELTLPKDFSIGNVQLQEVLDEIVDSDDQISTSLIMAGRLRNTLAHNMGWSSQLMRNQYQHCFFHIGLSCLHTIATIYRSNE